MNKSFEVGTVVTLKSGGQKMTVEGYDHEKVLCVWFEKSILKRDSFVEDVLTEPEQSKYDITTI